MLNTIDKNLLIAIMEKALDYVYTRASIESLNEIETSLGNLRVAFDTNPDAVTAEQIEAMLVLIENAKFPSLKYISWAFPFWGTPSVPTESLLSWLSDHLLWNLILDKPSTYPPQSHTHPEYLESVTWEDIIDKPSTYSPQSHTHAQYLESVAWSIITDKPSTYPPEEHSHALIGEIRMWATTNAPSKWMICQGQAVSRSTYTALYAIIGDTYGEGDGSTTFNLPDLRGRVPMGAGQGSGLTNRVLGETIGEESISLTSSENGPHSHAGPSHSHPMPHTHTGPSHSHPMPHTHTGPSHSHPMPHTHIGGLHTHPVGRSKDNAAGSAIGAPSNPTPAYDFSNTSSGGDVQTSASSAANTSAAGTGNTGASSAANTSAAGTGNTGASSAIDTSAAGTGNTGASGSGTPHNNMQPSLSINFIIFTDVE